MSIGLGFPPGNKRKKPEASDLRFCYQPMTAFAIMNSGTFVCKRI